MATINLKNRKQLIQISTQLKNRETLETVPEKESNIDAINRIAAEVISEFPVAGEVISEFPGAGGVISEFNETGEVISEFPRTGNSLRLNNHPGMSKAEIRKGKMCCWMILVSTAVTLASAGVLATTAIMGSLLPNPILFSIAVIVGVLGLIGLITFGATLNETCRGPIERDNIWKYLCFKPAENVKLRQT